MPLPKPTNLYEAVRQRGSIVRNGDVTVLRMDGAGAIATATMTFSAISRWAQSKTATGIVSKDRMQFLERFEMFFARPGSVVQTRGPAKPLYELLKSMERVGMDIHDWEIPHSVEEFIKEAAARMPAKPEDKKDEEVPKE